MEGYHPAFLGVGISAKQETLLRNYHVRGAGEHRAESHVAVLRKKETGQGVSNVGQ